MLLCVRACVRVGVGVGVRVGVLCVVSRVLSVACVYLLQGRLLMLV